MRRHPDSNHLTNAPARCVPFTAPWSGTVFRSASVRYANRDDFLTGVGAKAAGARWNPPASFATVYTSLSPDTATAEALAHHRHFHLPVENALPRVLAAVQVVLQRVLDLTDAKARKALRVSRETLLTEDWRGANAGGDEALTQAIGRLFWEGECEGLLVPSAADSNGITLIIFPGNLTPPDSYLLIVNRGHLPPLPAT